MSHSDSHFESEFATKVIPRAWRDQQFKARLLANPRAALEEAGVTPPPNMNLRVVENTDNTAHLILPPPPSAEIDEESLAVISGGWIPAARLTFGQNQELTNFRALQLLNR